jgi:predicted transcriptional regulator
MPANVSQLTFATPAAAYKESQSARELRMSDNKGADVCGLCDHGKVITRNEELAFHQWTSRGYVFCKVRIPMGTCDRCSARTWDEAAEAIIEQAVSQAHEKLS